jgi:hypothetical protein
LTYRTELSPNFTPGWPGGRPKALVVHSTRSGQDWADEIELSATLNWFSLPGKPSAHWVISATEQVRVVADENRAWHAKEHSDAMFGIELTQPLPGTAYQEGHYAGLVKVCREFYPDIPPMHIFNAVNGIQGYTGHEDTAQGHRDGKSDPGDPFNWDKFLRMLRAKEEDDMTDEERKLLQDMKAGFDFQNKIIVGNRAAIDLLSKIAVSHERRLLKLGSKPEDGE